MTVKELYEWAVKNGAENFDIEIFYKDENGFYSADDTLNLRIGNRQEQYKHTTEKVVYLYKGVKLNCVLELQELQEVAKLMVLYLSLKVSAVKPS